MNQRNSDVKQPVSIGHAIRDPTKYKSPELEYEAVETDQKPDYDVKVDANPAYHCDVHLDANPAYEESNSSQLDDYW